jgi:hypothetical protein
MIDPRILQQHFRNVQQRQIPRKALIPTIPDPKPLTAIEAIPIPETIITQDTISNTEVTIQQEEKKSIKPAQEPINLVINMPPPIENIVIEEIEIEDSILDTEKVQTLQEEKIENLKSEEIYDPYGYYSGPRF